MGQYTEQVEHWVGEFLSSTEGELALREIGDRCGALLAAFLEAATKSCPPPDIEQIQVVEGVSGGLAPLSISDNERVALPGLLEDFLGYLERSGRLGGGAALGVHARQAATAHLLKRKERRATIKVGPNDPCPCGSGRKYKKCCMHA